MKMLTSSLRLRAEHKIAFIICLIISMLFVILVPFGFSIVPVGHVGIVNTFGLVRDKVLEPGVTWITPWSQVIQISVQTKMVTYKRSVLSSGGLSIDIELALQYAVEPQAAIDLYKSVGVDFENIIIVPLFSSIVREVTSKRDAKAMYTSETRITMHHELIEAVSLKLKPYGIQVVDVLLREVVLPDNMKHAIENKLAMEQEAERMQFVLQREQQEAERKEIEATGIQKFQAIVSQGIDEHLLRWKGIEATTHLAESTNSKLLFFGDSKTGLPLIYNSETSETHGSLRQTPSPSI